MVGRTAGHQARDPAARGDVGHRAASGRRVPTMPCEVETQTWRSPLTKTVQPPPSGSCSWQVSAARDRGQDVAVGDPRHRELAGAAALDDVRAAVVAEPAHDLVVGGDAQAEVLDQPRAHATGAGHLLQLGAGLGAGHADRPVAHRCPDAPRQPRQLQGGAVGPPEQPVAVAEAAARRRRRTRSSGRSPMPRPETGNGVGAPTAVCARRTRRGCGVVPRRTTSRAGVASNARASTATESEREPVGVMVL